MMALPSIRNRATLSLAASSRCLTRSATRFAVRPAASLLAPQSTASWTTTASASSLLQRHFSCGTRALRDDALAKSSQDATLADADEAWSKLAETDTVAEGEEGGVTREFESLRSLGVDERLVRALTVSPFQFTEASEVQYRVFQRLPAIVAPLLGSGPLPGFQGKGGDSEAAASTAASGPKDLMVKAKTGTGKTIAFLVPAVEARLRAIQGVTEGSSASRAFLELLNKNQPDFDISPLNPAHRKRFAEVTFSRNTVGTLIISPTRELAGQIAAEASKLTRDVHDYGVHLLIGGGDKRAQMAKWRKHRLDLVVATPGRLQQLLDENAAVRSACGATETLVLDEADTLLEMGFRDALMKIFRDLSPREERRNLLFSATFSKQVDSVAHDMMNKERDYIDCVPEGESNVHEKVPQSAYIVKAEEQFTELTRLVALDQLEHHRKSRVIVFCPTTKMAQLVAAYFKSIAVREQLPVSLFPPTQAEVLSTMNKYERKRILRQSADLSLRASDAPLQSLEDRVSGPNAFKAYELHSRMGQPARDRVARNFRQSTDPCILITTDVSARGVDYPNVTRVIQFGIPSNKEQYIHRVGRTGRAGKEGKADMILAQNVEENWPRFVGGNDLPLKVEAQGASSLREQVTSLWKQVSQERSDGDSTSISETDSLMCSPELSTLWTKFLQQPDAYAHILESDAPDSGSAGSAQFGQGADTAVLRTVYLAQLGAVLNTADLMGVNKSQLFFALQEWGRNVFGLSDKEVSVSVNLANAMGISKRTLNEIAEGFPRGASRNQPANTVRTNYRRHESYGGGRRISPGSFGDSGRSAGRSGGRDSFSGRDSFGSRDAGRRDSGFQGRDRSSSFSGRGSADRERGGSFGGRGEGSGRVPTHTRPTFRRDDSGWGRLQRPDRN
ncbi:unnamed protein product [Parajaminaea phylloscopi]